MHACRRPKIGNVTVTCPMMVGVHGGDFGFSPMPVLSMKFEVQCQISMAFVRMEMHTYYPTVREALHLSLARAHQAACWETYPMQMGGPVRERVSIARKASSQANQPEEGVQHGTLHRTAPPLEHASDAGAAAPRSVHTREIMCASEYARCWLSRC